MLPIRRYACKCGSMECSLTQCRFEPREPRWTDQYRFRKPYQPSDQTDVSRWIPTKDTSSN